MLLPSTTGDFGVMPGHVPTVAQLRPGVITVHKELDKQVRCSAGSHIPGCQGTVVSLSPARVQGAPR